MWSCVCFNLGTVNICRAASALIILPKQMNATRSMQRAACWLLSVTRPILLRCCRPSPVA